MASISEIVNVSISRDSQAVTRAGFGVMLHLGLHRIFDNGDLVREYTSAADLLTDGFRTTDSAYIAASKYFSAPVAPESILIARRATADTVTVTPTAVNSTAYTVTINGTAFTFTSDGTATVAEIVAGLVAAINAGSEPVTATNSTTHVTLNPDVASTYYSVAVNANMTITMTASQTWAQDIAAIREANDTWYALTTYSHLEADIADIAAAIESTKKIYGYSSSDAGIITSSTTDVASDMSAAGYTRTHGLYSAVADTTYPEARWFGEMLPKDPGSATWKFKTLSGITADNLTTTQRNYANGKNINTYETIGGVDITREGVAADGEFIDVQVGADWLEARLEERIYSRLVGNDKLPYTDAGITVIEAEIRAQLQEAIDAGYLAASPAPTVTVPKVANVSSANKLARLLTGVTFQGTLAGAIHKTTINGSVVV